MKYVEVTLDQLLQESSKLLSRNQDTSVTSTHDDSLSLYWRKFNNWGHHSRLSRITARTRCLLYKANRGASQKPFMHSTTYQINSTYRWWDKKGLPLQQFPTVYPPGRDGNREGPRGWWEQGVQRLNQSRRQLLQLTNAALKGGTGIRLVEAQPMSLQDVHQSHFKKDDAASWCMMTWIWTSSDQILTWNKGTHGKVISVHRELWQRTEI